MTKFTIVKGEAFVRAWPCTVNEPADPVDGVAQVTQKTLTAHFALLGTDRIDELMKSGGERAVLQEVIKDWDVRYDDGARAPLSELPRYLLFPFIRMGLWDGYVRFISGVAEKN